MYDKPATRNVFVLLYAVAAFVTLAVAYRCYQTDFMTVIFVESVLGVVAWIVTDIYSIEPQSDCNPFAAIVAWSVMRLVKITPPRDDNARVFCYMIDAVSFVLIISYTIYSARKLSKRIMAEAARDLGCTLPVD